MSRCAVVFGQFGAAADPANLPAFRDRLAAAGVETILIQHDDSTSAVKFLRGYIGKKAIIGASLGAMSAIVFAKYLYPEHIDFVGGFQPSDFDPSGVSVNIEEDDPPDVITRAIAVPSTVRQALVFRNPESAMTGGFGHATYILEPGNTTTKLTVVKRLDLHPGDFPPASDQMFEAAMGALS